VRLSKLSLRQFRNLTHLEFEPGPVLNVIYGDNAQGKTSILEAIYFLSTLSSFRTGKVSDLIQFETGAFQLSGQLAGRKQMPPLDLKVRVDNGQRVTSVNEKAVSSRQFVSQLKTVIFSPESLGAIKFGPDQRRTLIDQAVFQLLGTAAEAQMSFSRALKQRNACLKQLRDGEIDLKQGHALLESLDEVFLKAAAEVTFYRLQFLDDILPQMQEILCKIIGQQCMLDVLYESGEKAWTERSFEAVSARLREELEAPTRRVAEVALGSTLTGPHRHDITLLFNENDSRIYCSQGQQRALILSFKMAETVYHSKVFESFPLLLLDDVLSEFDEKKREFLIEFLRANEAQTFLTTTDQARFLQGCSFRIEAGQIFSAQ
jgi:DNA replication and repair protein RecF